LPEQQDEALPLFRLWLQKLRDHPNGTDRQRHPSFG
jgi:hypothetical protein